MSDQVQGDLFDVPKKVVTGDICANRHQGADTSVAAFQSTPTSVRTRQRDEVLHFIKQRGSHGATCSEVEDALRLSHQAASARITELSAAGSISHGTERRLTKSNKSARVYRAAIGKQEGGH